MWIVEEFHTVAGIFYSEEEANDFAGIKKEEPKLAGAIVEEPLLEADLDGDGTIELEEMKTWLSESEEKQ
jgi:hypothetical protein